MLWAKISYFQSSWKTDCLPTHDWDGGDRMHLESFCFDSPSWALWWTDVVSVFLSWAAGWLCCRSCVSVSRSECGDLQSSANISVQKISCVCVHVWLILAVVREDVRVVNAVWLRGKLDGWAAVRCDRWATLENQVVALKVLNSQIQHERQTEREEPLIDRW